MIYNMACDIVTRKVVWVFQHTQSVYSSVQVATINRKASELLTSKRPL
jgi:hypothetical protein